MLVNWRKAGYTKEDLQKFRPAFEALKDILETDFKKKEADRDYSPGWEHRQIAINEYNSAVSELLKLLTIEKE